MRGQRLWIVCDVADCGATFDSEQSTTGRWDSLYSAARAHKWLIREDTIVGGGRRRKEHRHFCPAHRPCGDGEAVSVRYRGYRRDGTPSTGVRTASPAAVAEELFDKGWRSARLAAGDEIVGEVTVDYDGKRTWWGESITSPRIGDR